MTVSVHYRCRHRGTDSRALPNAWPRPVDISLPAPRIVVVLARASRCQPSPWPTINMVRGALAALLALEPDITIVGEVARGDEVSTASSSCNPM